MNAVTLPLPRGGLDCHYRPLILVSAAIVLLGVFWFASRYPQLLAKADHIGQALPSMAFSGELIKVSSDAPIWRRIGAGAVNWLDGMKLGMSFGVLLGALLHTTLRYYPLKVGKNLYLNSLKGALVGIPAGVCTNCAVPTACGLTRSQGRVEVALGFLFSSPNFNPVVVTMTFMALPLTMSITKYAVLLLVILVGVPALISRLERDKPLVVLTVGDDGMACALPAAASDCTERFWSVLQELTRDYAKNIWMLLKPTLVIMLLASVTASLMLTLIPWQALLSDVTPLRLAFISVAAVFMPVPIALDVMFPARLYQEGVAGGYVMLFAMTLGSYSIIPSIYLWREISKPLAVILFAFFVCLGWVVGLLF